MNIGETSQRANYVGKGKKSNRGGQNSIHKCFSEQNQ